MFAEAARVVTACGERGESATWRVRLAIRVRPPADGRAVVGAEDGSGVVGAIVVGSAVGDSVGWADGRAVVGAAEGDGVGWADGRAVVGENVGPCVGAAVGAQATVAVEDCA